MTDKNFSAKFAQFFHRIGVAKIASGDFVTHAQQHSSNAAHARAANANEMNGS